MKNLVPLCHKNEKQDITDILMNYLNSLLNRLSNIIRNDLILNGIEASNTQTQLKTKMGYFYEQLFYYLCNFTHTKTGFDLVNEKDHMFIELKRYWNTDNHDGKERFHLLRKYKTNNPNA